jgi:hypothetical protein
VTEVATWAGHRDAQDPYGFASFDVDPGEPGGLTKIEVTFYRTSPSTTAAAVPVDRFILQRPRSDSGTASGSASGRRRRSGTPGGAVGSRPSERPHLQAQAIGAVRQQRPAEREASIRHGQAQRRRVPAGARPGRD